MRPPPLPPDVPAPRHNRRWDDQGFVRVQRASDRAQREAVIGGIGLLFGLALGFLVATVVWWPA